MADSTLSSGSATHTYKFGIAMNCSGCSGAIERVLKKMDGIQSYTVSLESQSADIITSEGVEYESVLEKIKKTGKKVTKGEADGVEKAV